MSLETDLLLDRRRLKRRLFLWRLLALLAVLAVVLVGTSGFGPFGPRRHVARLEVSGLITEDRQQIAAVSALAEDPSVAALIVSVDSPGGSVAGGEGLHDAIVRVAAKKPVVTVMGGVAASAGYMVSVPSARIFARNATLTGSIGVLLESPEISGLLGKLGVQAQTIVSGPLKDQPSFTHPLSDQGHEVLQALVMDFYDQFVTMVATGRHMDPARVRELGDGRAYTGRQAVTLGLVDQIGDEIDARDWLAQQKQVPKNLPVITVRPGDWRTRAARGLFGSLADTILSATLERGVLLDGAWSVWQP